MVRLVNIELLKLIHSKSMWVLLALYLLAIAGISFGAGMTLEYLASIGISYRNIDPTVFPIYDFEDIWQNLAYLGYFFKIFPAFLLIISMCNEFSNKTHRQNIIDGLSRREFFFSKLSFAAFLAFVSAGVILILGLVLGFLHSATLDGSAIVRHLGFVPAHAFQLFLYFLFAMFLAILIRRTGFTIVLLLMYTVFIEPVSVLLANEFIDPMVGQLLPLSAISDIVPLPFTRYILLNTQNFISAAQLAIGGVWGLVFSGGIFYLLQKKDF